ncbi:SAF domain-containing protein [uncultured Arthrobacter sp.]|uniref:SAF domain-containing protein n=1 Tax=uncultured Arthrobacter sp. TaxID=114050 RepID=UPI00261A5BCF|nr:SAF domain-containing protein [uncultured Arthrobacter sp.]
MSLKMDNAVSTNAPLRLRKPSWKDPRLLIGILLVCVSIVGVIALVESADKTIGVYAAREDLPVGAEISEEDLSVVPVRLGEVEGSYRLVSEGLPDNAVAQRLIPAGELLPVSGVGPADALDRKPVGLTVEDPLPAGTARGDRVDVWISPRGEGNEFGAAELLLEGAEIYGYAEEDSALGASQSARIFVLVGDETLPALLDALSNEARIAVVVNSGAR